MQSLELINLPPGSYVLAVSGGVDSIVLLDILARQPSLKIVVAHFHHGMREDADEDEKLVRAAAAAYNVTYIYDKGHLGAGTSEAAARAARYKFLRRAAWEHNAKIITAHHQDDVLETAILNLLRGTGRKGLSSLQSTNEVMRPLLHIPKCELITYAQEKGLQWREDSSNANEQYLRNYVRRQLAPRLGEAGRARLIAHITRAKELNEAIDELITLQLPRTDDLQRRWFIALPYNVSLEMLAGWLRRYNASFDKRSLHRLTVAVKTLPAAKRLDVDARWRLLISKTSVKLAPRPSQKKNRSV